MDLETAIWHKSSHSNDRVDCVEVAFVPGIVAVRDTKNRSAGALQIPAAAWHAFTGSID